MPKPNKYASDGRKYDVYNPRPESSERYFYTTYPGCRPYNVGKNKNKRIMKAQSLELKNRLRAKA